MAKTAAPHHAATLSLRTIAQCIRAPISVLSLHHQQYLSPNIPCCIRASISSCYPCTTSRTSVRYPEHLLLYPHYEPLLRLLEDCHNYTSMPFTTYLTIRASAPPLCNPTTFPSHWPIKYSAPRAKPCYPPQHDALNIILTTCLPLQPRAIQSSAL